MITLDTITHAMFGAAMYASVDKSEFSKRERTAFLVTSLVASQIPDSDVIANVTETGRIMEQMWHRGLTHSIFFVPIWAFLIYWFVRWIWNVKDRRIFYLASLGVFLHNTLDSFNAWGTGYFEPFSDVRLTFGTLSIIDFVFWGIFIVTAIVARKKERTYTLYRRAFVAIAVYFIIQSSVGFYYLKTIGNSYDEATLSASFIPFQFDVIGKQGENIEVVHVALWKKETVVRSYVNNSNVDIHEINEKNPRIAVLQQWSPFIVAYETSSEIGIFDPRFFVNGDYLLREYIKK